MGVQRRTLILAELQPILNSSGGARNLSLRAPMGEIMTHTGGGNK